MNDASCLSFVPDFSGLPPTIKQCINQSEEDWSDQSNDVITARPL